MRAKILLIIVFSAFAGFVFPLINGETAYQGVFDEFIFVAALVTFEGFVAAANVRKAATAKTR